MAGAMLGNSNFARKIQEEVLGSPLDDDDSQDSQKQQEAPPTIDYRTLPEFNPLSAGLGPDFRLSRYCDLKGRGCRVPGQAVAKTLSGVKDCVIKPPGFSEEEVEKRVGVGTDCTITPIRHGGLCIISNTDMFYPIIDDPYIMGRVACVSLLSDVHAMGVTDIDNVLMYLGISTRLTETERNTIVPLIIRGFKDAAKESGARLSGGQTVFNPWLMVGGCATSVCAQEEYVVPDSAVAGDVLVLTKPLGTALAVNCYQWHHTDPTKVKLTEEEVKKAYKRAVDLMGRSNRGAARLMHKYSAHAATHIGGQGLLRSADNLARCQRNNVSLVVHNLPVIAKMAAVSKTLNAGNMFGLAKGEASECSGGLLIVLPREQAATFCKDIENEEGHHAWIIGIVESGDRGARVIDKPRIIEVPGKDTPDQIW